MNGSPNHPKRAFALVLVAAVALLLLFAVVAAATPTSSGVCSDCHSAGGTAPTVTITSAAGVDPVQYSHAPDRRRLGGLRPQRQSGPAARLRQRQRRHVHSTPWGPCARVRRHHRRRQLRHLVAGLLRHAHGQVGRRDLAGRQGARGAGRHQQDLHHHPQRGVPHRRRHHQRHVRPHRCGLGQLHRDQRDGRCRHPGHVLEHLRHHAHGRRRRHHLTAPRRRRWPAAPTPRSP